MWWGESLDVDTLSGADGGDTILDPLIGDEANVLRFGDDVTAEGLEFRATGGLGLLHVF